MFLGSLEPSFEGTLKLNVDDSFIEDSLYLGLVGLFATMKVIGWLIFLTATLVAMHCWFFFFF
jgi:hypothetical protein